LLFGTYEPVDTSATNGSGLVNVSMIINEPAVDASHLPSVDTVADLFGVPLKSLKDIDVLTSIIEVGECEDVMMAMTSVERIAVMEAIEAVWKKILAENTSDYPPLMSDFLFLMRIIRLLLLVITWGRIMLMALMILLLMLIMDRL
ncbi:hypothetical protein Tco_0430479, partial [Tanacetum coccineum]